MKTSKKTLSVAVLSLAAFPAAHAMATVVYSDNFETDTVGSAPAGWVSNSGNLTLSTVADAITGGVGSTQSMDLTQNNSPAAGTPETSITSFTPVTLADTESLVLTYVVQSTTATTTQDRVFRFGVYNSMTPNAASPTISTTGTPEGYAGRIDEGTGTPTSMDAWSSVGFLGSSTTSTPAGKSLATSSSTIPTVSNSVDTITMTLTRVGSNITNSITITNSAGTVTITGTDSTQLVRTDTGYTFNEIMIGQSGGAALDYRVDNVSLTYNPVSAAAPEPASLGLAGVGAITLLARRRRRH